MPTLLQINVTANWGSTGTIAEHIGSLMLGHGWKSHIAYGRHVNPSASELLRVGNRRDILAHVLASRLGDAHGLASRRATRKLVAQITDMNPDVIHLHNLHGYYLNYPILFRALRQMGKPIVWTLHDCWTMTGHCTHPTQVPCGRWQMGCHDCPIRHAYPASMLLDRSRRNFAMKRTAFTSVPNLVLVPVSRWLAGLVEQSFLKDYPIRVIHNGVNLKQFSPKTEAKSMLGFSGRRLLLAVASVWTKEKGLEDLWRLRDLLPRDCEIVIIGLSSKQLKQLPEGVQGLARTQKPEQLAHYYAAADVLLNPTYHDTFPTVNLEALAAGTPVVTYQTDGSPETIDAHTGSVVKQGDVAEMAQAALALSTPDRRETLRRACRARAQRLFNKEDRYAEYFHLYEELLHRT